MAGRERYMSGHGERGHGGGHGKGHVRTIDDFLSAEGHKHAADIGQAFEHFDAFTDEENVNQILVGMLVPAHDKLYTTLSSELGKLGDVNAKVHGKKKELETAVTSALKAYFKDVMPSALTALKGIEEDEHYEILTRLYDQHTGADRDQTGRIGTIRSLVEMARNKQAKVADVLQTANRYRQQHPQTTYAALRERVIGHHFSRFHAHQIGGYLKNTLPKYQLAVSDPTTFASQSLGGYLQLYEGLKTGRMPEGGYDTFGVERAKTAKEKKAASGHGGH